MLILTSVASSMLLTPGPAASADDQSIEFDKLFKFVDKTNMEAGSLSQNASDFKAKSLDLWKADERQKVSRTLISLLKNNKGEIERTSRGEQIRLFRTHSSLVADRNQNSATLASPSIRTVYHDILFTDEFFDYWKLNTDYLELQFALAHELGHVADVESALSFDPAWLRAELPKLAKYRRISDSAARAKKKLTSSAQQSLAKSCDLSSVYASRHPSEDFADTYAELLCAKRDKRISLSGRHTLLKKILDSVPPARVEAFQCAILASRSYCNKNYTDSLQKINRAIVLAPDVGSFYLDRVVYDRKNLHTLPDLNKARAIYLSARVPEYDGSVRYLGNKLATFWGNQHNFVKQKAELLRLFASDSSDPLILNDLANCYFALHDNKNALRYANKAVAADELCADAYRVRAHVLYEIGRNEDAINDLTLCLYIEPKNEAALFDRGKCFFSLGAYSKARQDVVELLRINSKDIPATFSICLIDFRLGEYQRAIEEADRANALKERSIVYSVKSWCLLNLKRFAESERLIKKAIAMKFDDTHDTADAYCCLALAKNGLKEKSEALKAVNKALKLQASSAQAKNILKEIQKSN